MTRECLLDVYKRQAHERGLNATIRGRSIIVEFAFRRQMVQKRLTTGRPVISQLVSFRMEINQTGGEPTDNISTERMVSIHKQRISIIVGDSYKPV